jgi:hypothetical protein
MNDDTYNGWSNYETWVVDLWLTNERGSYEYWRDYVESALRQYNGDIEKTVRDVAEHLECEFSDSIPEVYGMWVDLINGALSRVDWHELAASWCAR